MINGSETAPRRSSVTLALATTLTFAVICLAAGLWNSLTALPLAAVFLTGAYGIYKRHAWSAYGVALLLAALVVRTALGLASLPAQDVPGAVSIALTGVVVGLAVAVLVHAGRRMPSEPAPVSRVVWIAIAALFFGLPQFYHAYIIASGSMEPTILIGDQVLVRPLTGAPSRGDLVQHRYPIDPKQSFLKRVVAVGGDRVRLRNKQLIVNGTPVDEPYVVHRTGFVDDFRDNFPAEPNMTLRGNWAEELRAHTVNGELVVPPGKFFVLGDNRDESLDSRYFGFLDRSEITGKPVLIYFSADAPGPVLLHPSRIRWQRVFKRL